MKPKTRVSVAKDFQKQIYNLEEAQYRLYNKAIKTLKVADTLDAYDYFYNGPGGYNTFLEKLND